jgi:glycine dehydrogenase subunit 2
LQPIETVQGNLALMFEMQEWLKEISGFAGVTLQPAAGAHGEFTGVLMMARVSQIARRRQTHQDAHPRCGAWDEPRFGGHVGHDRSSPSHLTQRGNVDLKKLEAACDDTVVGMMLTNPNTLGMFDETSRK